MLYYSTNKTLQTVCSIREARKAKYLAQLEEWAELSQFVYDNWDDIYFNACLLDGQTASLGVEVHPVAEDYYAPERIWVHFLVGDKVAHSVELHRDRGVKYIDGVRYYSSASKRFTPREIIGVNLEVAKRVLCVLGMTRVRC